MDETDYRVVDLMRRRVEAQAVSQGLPARIRSRTRTFQRRRRAGLVGASGVAVAGLVAAVVVGIVPALSSSHRVSTATNPNGRPASTVPRGTPVSTVTLGGNGVAGVAFGENQETAISELDHIFGQPVKTTDGLGPPACGKDTSVQWPEIVAFFFEGRFVGYTTMADDGTNLARSNEATAAGVRVGDSLAQARQLYGSALTTSFAQGGTWFAATAEGRIEGYLTAEPVSTHNQPPVTTIVAEPGEKSTLDPRIASIEAGSLGCPAATP